MPCFFSPLDVKSFRDALRKLLASKELCDSIGRSARAIIAKRHTWEENARQILGNVELFYYSSLDSVSVAAIISNSSFLSLLAPLGGAVPVQFKDPILSPYDYERHIAETLVSTYPSISPSTRSCTMRCSRRCPDPVRQRFQFGCRGFLAVHDAHGLRLFGDDVHLRSLLHP